MPCSQGLMDMLRLAMPEPCQSATCEFQGRRQSGLVHGMSLSDGVSLCRKHYIEQERQWDFLKELTAKIPDVTAEVVDSEEAPSTSRRGR